MAIAYIAGAKRADSTSGPPYQTDPGITTTNANLLVAALGMGYETAGNNKTGTYTKLGTDVDGWYEHSIPMYVRLQYMAGTLDVGSGHRATTATFYAPLIFAAFSGADASPANDTDWAEASSGEQITSGTVTPSGGGELIVTVLCVSGSVTGLTQPSGYQMPSELDGITGYSSLSRMAVAYKIKDANDSSSESPQWTWTTSRAALVKTATFKPGAAASSIAPQLVTGRTSQFIALGSSMSRGV